MKNEEEEESDEENTMSDNNNNNNNKNKKTEEQDQSPAFVWYIYIDLYCLNYSGNLLDACLIALLAALRNGMYLYLYLCIYLFIPIVLFWFYHVLSLINFIILISCMND